MNPVKYAAQVRGMAERAGFHVKDNASWQTMARDNPRLFATCLKLMSRVPNGSRPQWAGYVFNANRR